MFWRQNGLEYMHSNALIKGDGNLSQLAKSLGYLLEVPQLVLVPVTVPKKDQASQTSRQDGTTVACNNPPGPTCGLWIVASHCGWDPLQEEAQANVDTFPVTVTVIKLVPVPRLQLHTLLAGVTLPGAPFANTD